MWVPDLGATPGPRYLALANAIARAIARGMLAPGSRLPPRRELAYRLGISIHTVASAYAEAERRGLVIGEVGRGTFVRGPHPLSEPRFLADRREGDLFDLSVCRPAIGDIHRGVIRDTFGRLQRDGDLAYLLACRPIAGLDRHRQAAVAWLGELGLRTPPERVLLTNGCAHGLLVALATLVQPGDLVATEALTDHGVIALSNVLHFRLKGLATDDEGILPEAFEAACRSRELKVLCCTPNLTNPTTTLMGAERRREIARIARAHGVHIVEDDVFAALVEDRPPPLAALAPELTCYVTSFTKCAVSGLRTGYLVAPEPLVPRLLARVRASSWMATPLPAEMASRWIADGTMATLVAWQRKELGTRQRLADAALKGHGHARHPTGINVWLRLPPPWRADHFVTQARLRGIALTPAEPFVVGRQAEPHAVRLALGAVPDHQRLQAALAVVRDLLVHAAEPAFLDL